MIAITDLHGTAREYLRAAKLLRTRRSYDAAVYLCGYAVEIALKARLCRHLKWTTGFPETPAEFRLKGNLKTHDLETLLDYTGIQGRVRSSGPRDLLPDWSVVRKWNPEQRYDPRGTKTLSDADSMIAATQKLLRVLL
jgi:HEPN domain-containing protein